jgi:hypothetical protein
MRVILNLFQHLSCKVCDLLNFFVLWGADPLYSGQHDDLVYASSLK